MAHNIGYSNVGKHATRTAGRAQRRIGVEVEVEVEVK